MSGSASTQQDHIQVPIDKLAPGPLDGFDLGQATVCGFRIVGIVFDEKNIQRCSFHDLIVLFHVAMDAIRRALARPA